MVFTDQETAEHKRVLEKHFWSKRRPPLHLRDKIRDGQRLSGHGIDLFFVRPAFRHPGEFSEDNIARIRYVRTRKVWRLYWRRASGNWESYPPCREVGSLASALRVIHKDTHHCFFG